MSSSLFKIYLNKNYLFHSKNNPLILGRNMSSEINTTVYYIRSFILIIKEFIQIFLIGLIFNFWKSENKCFYIFYINVSGIYLFKNVFRKTKRKIKNIFFEREKK